jgi:hypothetical protein
MSNDPVGIILAGPAAHEQGAGDSTHRTGRQCAHGCWWWPQRTRLAIHQDYLKPLAMADLHEVGVAAQRTPCEAVLALLTRQVPDDNRLVPGNM